MFCNLIIRVICQVSRKTVISHKLFPFPLVLCRHRFSDSSPGFVKIPVLLFFFHIFATMATIVRRLTSGADGCNQRGPVQREQHRGGRVLWLHPPPGSLPILPSAAIQCRHSEHHHKPTTNGSGGRFATKEPFAPRSNSRVDNPRWRHTMCCYTPTTSTRTVFMLWSCDDGYGSTIR